MNKKGMSTIITTVIMIVLVLVAVGVVWAIVQNILTESADDISLGSLKIRLNIEKVKITDVGVDVQVKRSAGEANLVGINFIISDGENTEVFEEKTTMKQLATKTFSLSYFGVVKSVEIAPVLESESGKEKVGNIVDKETFTTKQILENLGIISWWRFEGNAQDEIGKNNGEKIGDVNFVDGEYGQAVNLGGNGDYISIPGFSSNMPKSEITIGVWAKPTTMSEVTTDLLSFDPISPGTGRVTVHFPWQNSMHWQFGSGGASLSIDLNLYENWNYLSFIASSSGNYVKIYRNGNEISTTTYGGDLIQSSSTDWHIGGRASNSFSGKIDEVMIFNKALTEEQVKALYELDLD